MTMPNPQTERQAFNVLFFVAGCMLAIIGFAAYFSYRLFEL